MKAWGGGRDAALRSAHAPAKPTPAAARRPQAGSAAGQQEPGACLLQGVEASIHAGQQHVISIQPFLLSTLSQAA